MNKLTLAPQERIDEFASTAREFFRNVLALNYNECVVTDESRLSDFSVCGLPEDLACEAVSLAELYAVGDAWVVPVICERYALVWFAINWLKKFPMHFGRRLGERRSHSRAMATTNNDAFGSKGAEIIQRINGKPH